MTSLGLVPLPTRRAEDELPESAGWADFVPEEAIQELLALPVRCETEAVPGYEFCLSVNDDDFAGVRPRNLDFLSRSFVGPTVRYPEFTAEDSKSVGERAVLDETPYPNAHLELPLWESNAQSAKRASRWWIPAVFGIVSASICSLVLFVHPPEEKEWDETPKVSAPLILPDLSPEPEAATLDPGSNHFAEAGYALR